MIENRKDVATTKEYRKRKIFEDSKSWISNAGHIYLEGKDKKQLRARLCIDSKRICAICKQLIAFGDEDLDHIRGGRKYVRCDCYFQRLNDGSLCTNVQLVHGMFSHRPCHRQKHNRETQWTRQTS
jgi:hypothetical protein